ncbi:MAG TPA: hypothetical protein VHN80_04155 [Kineosporiaceae bacterium]|nr:hypothetical protein [Kineosporiaceae bacterium]
MDGRLVRLDAATGAVSFTTADRYPSQWDGPHLTRIDGQPVVALTSSTAIAYVPCDTSWSTSSAGGSPTFVPLPDGARVTWAGSAPLILAPGVVGLIHAGGVQQVVVPPGAVPLAADGHDVIAQQEAAWLRISADGTQRHAFGPPSGASGVPARVEAVSARYLLAAWRKTVGGQAIALVDTTTAQTLVQERLIASLDITHSPLVRQVSGAITAVGSVIVDPDHQAINELAPDDVPISLTRGHAYVTSTATHERSDVALDRTKILTMTPFSTRRAIAPFAAEDTDDGQIALALTPTTTGWLLVGLSST